MDGFSALDIGGFLEWVQNFVEKRWGKFWSWVAYFGLVGMFFGECIWLVVHFVGRASG